MAVELAAAPACAVDDCTRPSHARSWCPTHYQRWRVSGSPLRACLTCGAAIDGPGQQRYCGRECRPRCDVVGCERPQRGESWCDVHRVQWQQKGFATLTRHPWAKDWICVVCDSAVSRDSGRRKHCSNNCQAMDSRHQGARPRVVPCATCGSEVDLLALNDAGRRKRTDTALCAVCRRRTRYGMTVGELAVRDGAECRICDEKVDMHAGPRDLFRPSVDHVRPRAVGGSDDPSNLQLAHLWCNQVKNKREGFDALHEPVIGREGGRRRGC